jgi:hypothetical protein
MTNSFKLLYKHVRLVEKNVARGGHVDHDFMIARQIRFVLARNDVSQIAFDGDFESMAQDFSFSIHVRELEDLEFTVVLRSANVNVNDTYEAAAEEGRQR